MITRDQVHLHNEMQQPTVYLQNEPYNVQLRLTTTTLHALGSTDRVRWRWSNYSSQLGAQIIFSHSIEAASTMVEPLGVSKLHLQYLRLGKWRNFLFSLNFYTLDLETSFKTWNWLHWNLRKTRFLKRMVDEVSGVYIHICISGHL